MSFVRRMLARVRSLWRMPWEWRYSRPCTISSRNSWAAPKQEREREREISETSSLFTKEWITFWKLFQIVILTTFPDLKAWSHPLWTQSSFKSGFWNTKKGAFWIVICLQSMILKTCECKALSEHDSCVRILEMCAEAMHGSISAVGTKYYLAVRRSCLWLGRRLQCLWTHIVRITNPIRKRIMIRNGFRNVIRSFVNRPISSTGNQSHITLSVKRNLSERHSLKSTASKSIIHLFGYRWTII